MIWKKHSYEDIPGTYVFDGKSSHQGYPLNKMAFSFNQAENREEFKRDPDAYCRKYGLSNEQREAVVAGDFLRLLQLGGNIYYLAKIAIFHGLSVQDAGAAMSGVTTEEFKAKLKNHAAGLQEKLARTGGYFDG